MYIYIYNVCIYIYAHNVNVATIKKIEKQNPTEIVIDYWKKCSISI